MHEALQIAALTALLFLAQEVLRHAGKWVLWALFLAVPLALSPYWARVNELDAFLWVKTFSVCGCVCWGALHRFTALGGRPIARYAIPLLLGLNILEATALDAVGGGLAHLLNAVAGVVLVVTLPYGPRATRVATRSRCRDLHYEVTRRWVCGYAVWNWTFVYLNYPALTGHHTAVLAAGLIVAAVDPTRWTQTRACTLGLNLVAMATFNAGLASWLDTSAWAEAGVGVFAAGTALVFVLGGGVRAFSTPGRPLPVIPCPVQGAARRPLQCEPAC